MEGIEVRNVKTGQTTRLDLDGFFVAIGIKPNSELAKGKLDMTPDGFYYWG